MRTKTSTRHANKGAVVRKDLRIAIHLRDGFRCVYCCRDMHGAEPFDLTLDHVIPQADGGTNDPRNMVTACRKDNCSRRDKPLSVFCGPETRADIRRLTRRSITKYRKLAKALIAGETGEQAKKRFSAAELP